MVKKATKTKKVVPTKEDIQRKQMIIEYNRNNTETQILERKVREEDIKDLEDRLKALQEKHATATYLIADEANAERVCGFLQHWNMSKFIWPKDVWRGVIKFNSYLTEWQAKFNNEPCALEFDFAAMSFAYNMLMNQSGIGYEAAVEMEACEAEYNAILEILDGYIKDFQHDNERFKLLQDCLAARYQGFMMVPAEDLVDSEASESSEENEDTVNVDSQDVATDA